MMTAVASLTLAQARVLRLLVDSTLAGDPWTFRDVSERLGNASTNALNGHVAALVRKGYLRRTGRSGVNGRYSVVGMILTCDFAADERGQALVAALAMTDANDRDGEEEDDVL